MNPIRPDDAKPLGLTIYDLPHPEATVKTHAQTTRAGRWRMLAVLLVCASPVVASYMTFYVLRPQAQRSFGELIEPQRNLPDTRATDLLTQVSMPLTDLKGQWLLISVGSGQCASDCEARLLVQRQLHAALGKERGKVEWVWFINDDHRPPSVLMTAISGARVLRVPPVELSQWLQPAAGHGIEEHLYLVDPLGHWMMRFPKAEDASSAAQVKRDLERLLRAATSWDREGR